MILSKVIGIMEGIAPPHYQFEGDNCGLQVRPMSDEIRGILVAYEATEGLVSDAVAKGCNLILVYHPLIFKPLKSMAGAGRVPATLSAAIRAGVGIYVVHSSFDAVADGVHFSMASALGLVNLKPVPNHSIRTVGLRVYVPKSLADGNHDYVEAVRKALHTGGAGNYGTYEECSFTTEGTGAFLPMMGAKPTLGSQGVLERPSEVAIEVLVDEANLQRCVEAATEAHPYEVMAYHTWRHQGPHPSAVDGFIGDLPEVSMLVELAEKVKSTFQSPCLRISSADASRKVSRVGVFGGSGAGHIGAFKAMGADVLITGDLKYHDFETGGSMVLMDVGHAESERFVAPALHQKVKAALPTFAVLLSESFTQPLRYII